MGEDKNWFVIKTISGQEEKIKKYINTEIQYAGLESYVGEILVPKEKTIQIRNGKKYQKERALYSGYVFAELDLAGEVPHVIKNVQGVIGFLSETKGGDPVPMRKSEVSRMLGKVDEMAENEVNIVIPYVKGETIKVIDGPFNGYNGVVENVMEDKRKLEVMVLIFGRKTPLELGFMQVEKI